MHYPSTSLTNWKGRGDKCSWSRGWPGYNANTNMHLACRLLLLQFNTHRQTKTILHFSIQYTSQGRCPCSHTWYGLGSAESNGSYALVASSFHNNDGKIELNRFGMANNNNKKAQLSLTNPRDACEKFARFT